MSKDELLDILAEMVEERLKKNCVDKPTPPSLSVIERKKVGEAADLISGVFRWSQTIEGEHYWATVRNRLRQISEDGKL